MQGPFISQNSKMSSHGIANSAIRESYHLISADLNLCSGNCYDTRSYYVSGESSSFIRPCQGASFGSGVRRDFGVPVRSLLESYTSIFKFQPAIHWSFPVNLIV